MASVKLPENISLDKDQQKEFSKKVTKAIAKNQDEGSAGPGVIYLGHIPHGFMELQMKKYFSQFGHVTKLRLARSKKTGGSKGYAFVEFQSAAVAQIVAETMNNYLMFRRLLKCQYLPMHKVHPKTFVGSDRHFKKPKAHLMAMQRHNKEQTAAQRGRSLQRIRAKNKTTSSKLAEMGIDYTFDMPGAEDSVSTRTRRQQGVSSKTELEDEPDDVKPTDEELQRIQEEAVHVLYDDSDEDEIEFRTPPQTVRRRSSVYKPSERQAISSDKAPKTRSKRTSKQTTPKTKAKRARK